MKILEKFLIIFLLFGLTFVVFCKTQKDSAPNEFRDTRDGIVYKTVQIGDQVWMAENLRAQKYRNGDFIPNTIDGNEWANLNESETGAYCFYDNADSNGHKYGCLYNWYAVHDSRGLAPEGWHIPSDEEWSELIHYLGGEEIAGDKMKESGTVSWDAPNNASNESEFSALPGGFRDRSGGFSSMGSGACYWSSTELDSYYAWDRLLGASLANAGRGSHGKLSGFSIRCVKD